VPMLLSGDEVLRTQHGNNNVWCQDNELSWFDWRLTETNGDMLRFVRELIALRKRHANLTRNAFFTGGLVPGRGIPDVVWHGFDLQKPLWHDPQAQILAYTLAGLDDREEDLHVILNMSEATFEAPLPAISGRRWHLAVDTSLPSPTDIVARHLQKSQTADIYSVGPRSVVVFEARGGA
jgi:isoamylase